MALERIELEHIFGKDRRISFETGGSGSWRTCRTTIGRLPDGRFFAERIGPTAAGRPGDVAYVFYSEEEAVRVGDRWLRDGRDWTQVPAQFDGHGQPCDGSTWRRVGNRWVLGAGPDEG